MYFYSENQTTSIDRGQAIKTTVLGMYKNRLNSPEKNLKKSIFFLLLHGNTYD